METTVDKLEALFQKSEADLEYIEKRLKLDFINTANESGCPAESPVVMLQNLMSIKARHAALSSQVKELAAEQKQAMESLRSSLDSALEVVRVLQDTAELKESSNDGQQA